MKCVSAHPTIGIQSAKKIQRRRKIWKNRGGGHPCPSGFTSPDIQESYFSLGTENISRKQKWKNSKPQKLWYFSPIYPPDPPALIFEKSYFNFKVCWENTSRKKVEKNPKTLVFPLPFPHRTRRLWYLRKSYFNLGMLGKYFSKTEVKKKEFPKTLVFPSHLPTGSTGSDIQEKVILI